MNKVLIVDDEADMCLLLNILLAENNIKLDHAKDLSSAITYLESEQPSLIILDNQLPDGFGVDYISEIKKTYANLKVILISGLGGEVEDLALNNGADLFLTKPFTKNQICSSVKNFLN